MPVVEPLPPWHAVELALSRGAKVGDPLVQAALEEVAVVPSRKLKSMTLPHGIGVFVVSLAALLLPEVPNPSRAGGDVAGGVTAGRTNALALKIRHNTMRTK